MVEKHFITFYSPGTIVAEQTIKEVDSWSPEAGRAMMADIVERHGATPYGFRFTTRRNDGELDSREVARSAMYYVGGKVETREEIEARNLPDEDILRFNLRANSIERVWVSTKGWKTTQALDADDVVLA